jgi:hypothetical protein
MNPWLLRITLVVVSSVGLLRATDEPAPRTNMREAVKARMIEDAKRSATTAPTAAPAPARNATPVAAAETPAPSGEREAKPAASTAPAAKAAATAPAQSANASKQKQKSEPTVLPQVEVRKSRITELDHQLREKDKEIERELKHTRPTEVDKALNDAKIARPLAIFGGDSTQFRQHVASERVELLEAEKDMLEAIAQAKTKAEKQELQKQLDELRAVRRELEKTLR